jgi:hypothetical protein
VPILCVSKHNDEKDLVYLLFVPQLKLDLFNFCKHRVYIFFTNIIYYTVFLFLFLKNTMPTVGRHGRRKASYDFCRWPSLSIIQNLKKSFLRRRRSKINFSLKKVGQNRVKDSIFIICCCLFVLKTHF